MKQARTKHYLSQNIISWFLRVQKFKLFSRYHAFVFSLGTYKGKSCVPTSPATLASPSPPQYFPHATSSAIIYDAGPVNANFYINVVVSHPTK